MRRALPVLLLLVAIGGAYWYTSRPPTSLLLTGIVTTDQVVVSPQITGRLQSLLVGEGDAVAAGQLLAVLAADELRQEQAFYAFGAEGVAAQVQESEAALRLQEQQTSNQIAQAEATLASTELQVAATQAELDNAQAAYVRAQRLIKQGIVTIETLDAARTTFEVQSSRMAVLGKQIEAQRAAVALARSSAEQIAVRRSQLRTNRQQHRAASAQQAKAEVRLAYTELHAPIDGVVDVRAALPGEVVTAGQPVVTLVDPDHLWVRIDVEETFVDRVRLGDTLALQLPSGERRQGTVFFRAVDAGFATQRDVSRTKRDIKTFEIRLRVDNRDRRLAVGMTAYVTLPVV
jgi:HlyD family secretion protein